MLLAVPTENCGKEKAWADRKNGGAVRVRKNGMAGIFGADFLRARVSTVPVIADAALVGFLASERRS